MQCIMGYMQIIPMERLETSILKPIKNFNSNRKIPQYPHPQSAIKRKKPGNA